VRPVRLSIHTGRRTDATAAARRRNQCDGCVFISSAVSLYDDMPTFTLDLAFSGAANVIIINA